jgi:transposase
MNIREATLIGLSEAERVVLEGMVRSPKTEQRLAERARVVLPAGVGRSTRSIAAEVGCTIGTASKWRVRFAVGRLDGLRDKPRPGSVRKYDAATGRRILAQLDAPPPAGHARWTAPLLASALGDVSDQYIWRFLRAHKIDLAARKSWCVTTIRSSSPRRRRSSASTWRRLRTRSSWRWTRNRTFRRWSGRKAT